LVKTDLLGRNLDWCIVQFKKWGASVVRHSVLASLSNRFDTEYYHLCI
jgi:hypothetical protein